MVEYMRRQEYPGSDIVIEEVLEPGANYDRYIASYRSEGYKIYALLTVPNGDRPAAGWPAILFNHGYIPPEIYRTTERYVAYVETMPYTPSNKVAKHEMTAGIDDLRKDAWDDQDKVWR